MVLRVIEPVENYLTATSRRDPTVVITFDTRTFFEMFDNLSIFKILQYLPRLPESLKEFHKCFIECSSTKHKDLKGNTISFVLQKRLDCLKLYLKMAYIPCGEVWEVV